MDLTQRQNVQLLLKKHGLKPLKRFGQNFLIDPGLPQKLVASAQINAQDTVLEIGPGIGAITQALAQKAKRVVAVEKDREMVNILRDTLAGFKNVEVIQDDIRYLKTTGIQKYKVVGNLPFYLTAPVIRQFLEMEGFKPLSMTLVVQKEVAQRICAKPPKMSILANSVQFYAYPELISVISKKSFFPKPKVDAAIIKIIPHNKRELAAFASDRKQIMTDNAKKAFFRVMKAGFSQPRKQLAGNLTKKLGVSKEKILKIFKDFSISETARAENLSLRDWQKLSEKLSTL